MKKNNNLRGFLSRHLGPSQAEKSLMLKAVGVPTLEALIDEVIPSSIRLQEHFDWGSLMSEPEFLQHIKEISKKNQVFRSYIGLGYYNTVVPSVILRNLFENPGWYTQYTPYQAEISQGRLESLLNFQTLVMSLTAMDLANASLLDEATAAAEAMMIFDRMEPGKRDPSCRQFFVDHRCFPQTIDVVSCRAEQLGIEIVRGDYKTVSLNHQFFGALIQYPNLDGEVEDYGPWVKQCHDQSIQVAVAADLLSLTLLTPPGEWGADIVVGNTQRLGVPLGYGGPHAAYMATKEEYKRQIPGRIIGVSKDRYENTVYRMSLQTREQHIRKEKATSNICTAQALLANMAAMYAIYHGREGLLAIAEQIHLKTSILKRELTTLGYRVETGHFFDTLKVKENEKLIEKTHEFARASKINLRKIDSEPDCLGVSLDESVSEKDLNDLISVFAKAKNKAGKKIYLDQESLTKNIAQNLLRKTDFMTHAIFNQNYSETQMLRYLQQLERKDLSLNTSMIPLGSCTMKLNAATQMIPISWPQFNEIHPFVPLEQTQGYQMIFAALERILAGITGFSAVSLQPNSGAQGEYTGLLAIKKYHQSRDQKREVVLIPISAHGTNPASAAMAGLKIILVKCRENGDVDVADLSQKAEQHQDRLAALMITYPSTHGVFEDEIKAVCDTVHKYGGQVYMDGANMNAQIGYINPASIGADVCHLNLHKTFAIPHGGGGPGMGPVAVKAHLAPFLPGHSLIQTTPESQPAVSAAPWGSASILIISYAYLQMLGGEGLKQITACAILNANYLKARLEDYYPILYQGQKKRVAHEMIIDLRPIEAETGVTVEDLAKRLMDYGFHAPTISFPVVGTMMIEPTESEDKRELDRFCEAMISIRKEIDEVGTGKVDRANNVLKNAPHSCHTLIDWNFPYSIEKGIFPLPHLKKNKFWPSVSRINNVYGDRNFICSCPPLESYLDN